MQIKILRIISTKTFIKREKTVALYKNQHTVIDKKVTKSGERSFSLITNQ